MSCTQPPAQLPDAMIAALATRVGMTLPPECKPGVRTNLALLDDHWATLRRALDMDPPA